MKSRLFVLAFFATMPMFSGAVTIFDNTFLPQNWQLVNDGGTNSGTPTASRGVGSGLSGDERIVNIPRNNNFSGMTYQVENIKTNVSYNPAVSGGILSLGWEVWQRVPSASQWQSLRFLLKQGNAVYVTSTLWEPPIFTSSWQRASATATESTFSLLRGSGPARPDFSVTGGPINFGWLSFSSVFINSSVTTENSFFNVDVTPVPVPEPSTVIGLACFALGIAKRRRRAR